MMSTAANDKISKLAETEHNKAFNILYTHVLHRPTISQSKFLYTKCFSVLMESTESKHCYNLQQFVFKNKTKQNKKT